MSEVVGIAILLTFGLYLIYCVHEVLTLPRDDPRWGELRDAMARDR